MRIRIKSSDAYRMSKVYYVNMIYLFITVTVVKFRWMPSVFRFEYDGLPVVTLNLLWFCFKIGLEHDWERVTTGELPDV